MDLVENIENIFVFFVQKAGKILILNIDFHIDFRPSTFGHVFVFWIHDMHVLLSQFWLTEISSYIIGVVYTAFLCLEKGIDILEKGMSGRGGARHFSKPVVDQGLLI